MLRKLLLSIIFTVTIAATSFTQSDLNAPIPIDPNVRIGKLENELTYYIRKNQVPEKKAEFRLVVNAGSILERDDQQGLAHFLEHMAFNGTKNFKKNELVSYLQSIGVQFGPDVNAYTSFDETVYQLSLPTDKDSVLDKGMLVMKDWATSMTLDPAEVEKERGVVLEELRVRRGADQRIRDRYFQKLFRDSQYANRLPIGKKEILENFKYESLVDFYEDWYRPDLMALVIVGDVNVDEIENKIKANFSEIKAKRELKKRPYFSVPDHQETLVAVETDKEAPQSTTYLFYKTQPIEVKNQTDLRKQIVKNLYSQIFNDRLNEISQSPKPPFAFGALVSTNIVRTKGVNQLVSFTSPDSAKNSINTMLTEVARVKKFGFTQSEFERQKETYLASLENRFKERNKAQSIEFVFSYIGHYLSKSQIPGIEFVHQFNKAIVPTISLNEINDLSKELFTEKNRVIVVAGTEKENIKQPTQDELLSLITETENASLTPYEDKVTNDPLVGDLATKIKIEEEKLDNKLGTTSWTLSNGIKVILKPTDFKADEILMRAISPGGLSLVNDDNTLAGRFFNGFITEAGFKNISKIELDKKMSGKMTNVNLAMLERAELVNGSTNPQNFELMLQLVYLNFSNIKFSQTEFNSFKEKLKIELQNLTLDPQIFFTNEVSKIMNQNSPRVILYPTAEQLDKMKVEDMEAIYKDRFADASDFTFVFVGSFETEKIKPVILKYLGNLPRINRKENSKDLGIRPPSGKVEETFNKGVDSKSLVEINFTGETVFNREEGRDLAMLGEFLTIKLTEILREEKSGVYGVRASGGLFRTPYDRFNLTIEFPCGPENVNSLIKATLDEIAEIQNGKIDDADLQKVIEARLVKYKADFKSNNYWANSIQQSIFNNIPILTLEETNARAKAVTKADIQRIAKKYLKDEFKKQFVLKPEVKK